MIPAFLDLCFARLVFLPRGGEGGRGFISPLDTKVLLLSSLHIHLIAHIDGL